MSVGRSVRAVNDPEANLTMFDERFTLDELDEDGAIREGAERIEADSRADFLRKAVLAGGGVVGGGALLGTLATDASAQTRSDIAILNFALTLEYLEAEFYTRAERGGALQGRTREFARIVGAHERAHVAFLKNALGRRAVKKPRFNFRGTTQNQAAFQRTAQVLEDTGVKAYKGQAPLIDSDAILVAAAKIHSVEARHAAWIRHIRGAPPAPNAFDPAASKAQILRAVAATGFIVGPGRAPRPGGGPGLTGRV
jgi:Ferritin-like domain